MERSGIQVSKLASFREREIFSEGKARRKNKVTSFSDSASISHCTLCGLWAHPVSDLLCKWKPFSARIFHSLPGRGTRAASAVSGTFIPFLRGFQSRTTCFLRERSPCSCQLWLSRSALRSSSTGDSIASHENCGKSSVGCVVSRECVPAKAPGIAFVHHPLCDVGHTSSSLPHLPLNI